MGKYPLQIVIIYHHQILYKNPLYQLKQMLVVQLQLHKIFELLLRLRANTIWPAMHECTTPFYFVKGNAAVADSFGISLARKDCGD